MVKAFNNIINSPFIKNKVDFAKRVSFFGFDGVPVYDVFSFLIKEMQRDAITVRAASVAFNFLLSLFPAIIVLFTLIPYIPITDLRYTLLLSIHDFLPRDAYKVINATINDIVLQEHGGLLSIGLILAFYYTTNGVIGLMDSFEKAYPTFRKRTFVHRYLVSFKITLLLFLLLLGSVILIIAGEYFTNLIMEKLNARDNVTYLMLNFGKWFTSIILFYVGISTIYYYGAATQKKWKFFTSGSAVASILSILTSVGFSAFINHFGQYNKIYGSIGTLVVIMLWMYYNALILLIGFELNASIYINKTSKMPEPLPLQGVFENS